MTRDEERVLVIDRMLDAPRELVFAAWTQALDLLSSHLATTLRADGRHR